MNCNFKMFGGIYKSTQVIIQGMIYGCRDQNLSNETDCQVYYAYSYIKYILLDTKHRLLQPNKFFTKN